MCKLDRDECCITSCSVQCLRQYMEEKHLTVIDDNIVNKEQIKKYDALNVNMMALVIVS